MITVGRPLGIEPRALSGRARELDVRSRALPLLPGLSLRDRTIIAGARERLGATRASFGDAARALRDATEHAIAGGKIFHLGAGEFGPVFGSIVSGVGIADADGSVVLVRVSPRGRVVVFERLLP